MLNLNKTDGNRYGELLSAETCLSAFFALSQATQNETKSIILHRKPLHPRELLFHEGKLFTSIYIILSGSVKSYVTTDNGEEQITGFHYPGELLGVDGFYTGAHTCYVEALETSGICELPKTRLERLPLDSPRLWRQTLKLISKEIAANQYIALMLGKMSAEQKMAAFLLDICKRLNRYDSPQTLIYLSMTRYDIANYLSLAVETVSRLLTRLQKLDILEVKRHELRIKNITALRQMSRPTEY